MRTINSTLLEIQNSNVLRVSIGYSSPMVVSAGQRVFIRLPWQNTKLLPSIAYVLYHTKRELYLHLTEPLDLIPGMTLSLSHPAGNGFHPTHPKDKLLFLLPPEPYSFLMNYIFLLDLLDQVEISVIPSSATVELPRFVEIVGRDSIEEAIDWSDVLCAEVGGKRMSTISENPVLQLAKEKKKEAQILAHGHYGCKGLAECRLCEITNPIGKKTRLCENGPVFEITSMWLLLCSIIAIQKIFDFINL